MLNLATIIPGMFLEHTKSHDIYKVLFKSINIITLKNMKSNKITMLPITELNPSCYEVVDIVGNYII